MLAHERPVSNDQRNKKFTPTAYANFDENYQPINEAYPAAAPFEYTVVRNDTLSSIAARIWGDRSLWWIIADANGLSGAETLTEGMRLVIPNKVSNLHNNASTFKVYDAGEAIGDTSPTLPDAPPPPQVGGGKKGCGGIGTILVIIVAVVATVMTAGAAALASAGALSGASVGTIAATGASVLGGGVAVGGVSASMFLSTAAGFAGAAALGGAVGSVAGQLVGMATGVQDKFSWKQVGLSALGAGVTAGVGSAVQGSAAIAQFASTNPTVFSSVNAAANTLVTQATGSTLGLSSFSWKAVATSALASPIANYVGGAIGTALGNGMDGLPAQLQDVLGKGIAGTASAAVAQGIRMQVYNEGKIDWSSLALDAFGNAIGNGVVRGQWQSSGTSSSGYGFDAGHAIAGPDVVSDSPSHTSSTFDDFDEGYQLPGGYATGDAPDRNPASATRTLNTHTVRAGANWTQIVGSNPADIGLAIALNGRRNSTIYAGETVISGVLSDYNDSEIEQFKQVGLAALKQDHARLTALTEARGQADLAGMYQREANRAAAIEGAQSSTVAGAITATRSAGEAIFDEINQDMRETRGSGRGEAYARVARENFLSFSSDDKRLALAYFDQYQQSLKGRAAMSLDGRYASWAVREGAAIARAYDAIPELARYPAEFQGNMDLTLGMLGAAAGNLRSAASRSLGLGDQAVNTSIGIRSSPVGVSDSNGAVRVDVEGPYIELGTRQARAAARAYKEAFNSAEDLVIGRLPDTETGASLGMRRLYDPADWDPIVNDAWMYGGIDAGKPFYLGSNISIGNLRSGDALFPTTVFFRELKQLRGAEYHRQGDWMLPPKKN